MAYDGSGLYSLPSPEYPAIPDTVIDSSDYNAILEDLADALTSVILRNGVAAFTGNQSMGGFKLTNNADGSANTDLPTMLQVFTNPTFVGTDADGVTVTGTKLTVDTTDISLEASGDLAIAVTDDITISGDAIAITATSLTLPSGTTIGSLSTAELGYLDGVTSNVQTQLTAKANLAGGNTFTGTQNLTAALADGSTAATATSSDSSTKVATTAFVQQVSMNSALPNQSGNSGKYLKTNGTDASWEWTDKFFRSARTSNTILGTSDHGKFIDATTGSFTQTYTASDTLGDGWFVLYRNSSTTTVTHDPNSSENFETTATYDQQPGSTLLIICDGTQIRFVVVQGSTGIVHFQDQKSSATAADSFSSATWNKRTLNTTIINSITGASIASSVITLPAGLYRVNASGATNTTGGASSAGLNRLRLRNTTDGATLLAGMNASSSNAGVSGNAQLMGYFALTGTKSVELQHYVASGTNGGEPVATGEVEVYANLLIEKLS